MVLLILDGVGKCPVRMLMQDFGSNNIDEN